MENTLQRVFHINDAYHPKVALTPTLPPELIQEIFSYLIGDIDTLSQSWSQVCRLSREFMRKGLEHYCKRYEVNYAALEKEYNDLLNQNKKGILPLSDIIRYAVSRKFVSMVGKNTFYNHYLSFNYIPKSLYQFGILPFDIRPSKSLLRMAIMVGNKKLILSLLKDPATKSNALLILESILLNNSENFLPRKNLNLGQVSLPWEVIDSAFIGSFIVCYDQLEAHLNTTRQTVIQKFLQRGEFIFVENLLKAWQMKIEPAIAVDLLFKDLVSFKRRKTWYELYAYLNTQLSDTEWDAVLMLLDQYLAHDKLDLTGHDLNWLYIQLNGEHHVSKKLIHHFSHALIMHFKTADLRIKLGHIFNVESLYIRYALQHNMVVGTSTLLNAVEALHFCIPEYRVVATERICHLLVHHIHLLKKKSFREALLTRVLNTHCLPILQTIITHSHHVDGPKLLAAASPEVANKIKNTLQTGVFLGDLEQFKSEIIEKRQAQYIQGLLEAGICHWEIEWSVFITQLLEKDNYKTKYTLQLCHFLLDQKLICATSNLLKSLCNYIMGLSESVYKKAQYVVVDLADAINLMWRVLNQFVITQHDGIYSQCSISDLLHTTLKWIHGHVNTSFSDAEVLKNICSPFRIRGLTLEELEVIGKNSANILTNAFKLRGLELENNFFIKKSYPGLLEQLKIDAIEKHIKTVLSLFSRPKLWVLLHQYSNEMAHRYLEIAGQLIVEYKINDRMIIDRYMTEMRIAHRWDLMGLVEKSEPSYGELILAHCMT